MSRYGNDTMGFSLNPALAAEQQEAQERSIATHVAGVEPAGEFGTFRGKRWFVADARWDPSGLGNAGSHWHLTLTAGTTEEAPDV